MSKDDRIREISGGPIAFLRFEQAVRTVDPAEARQLGWIWTSVRREAAANRLDDADLNWIIVKARATLESLEHRERATYRLVSVFAVAGLVGVALSLVSVLLSMWRKPVVDDESREQSPSRPQSELATAGELVAEAARRRFEFVFDRLPVACCSFEVDGRVTAWNKAAEEITGKFSGDVLQSMIWDAVAWRQMTDVVKTTLATLFRGEQIENLEWVYQHPNGERRQFQARLLPYLSPSNKVTGGLIAMFDVTRQREQEELVRESNETNAAILSALPDCLLRLDSYGRLLDFSHEPNLTGARLADFRDTARWTTALPDRLGEKIMAEVRVCLETGEPQSFEHHSQVLETYHLLVRIVPCGSQQALAILHDITDRYRAEMAIRDSETRLRDMIQGSADILTVVLPDGTVSYQSPAVETICGIASESVLHQPLVTIVHPDDRGGVRQMIRNLSKTPFGEARHSCRFVKANGETLDVEILARNLLSNPYVNGIVLNTRDVTDRRRLESELQRRISEVEAINERLAQSKLDLERANQTLSQLATTDGLTGLNNHRAFQDALARAISESLDDDRPLSIVLLDVDKFKDFNDAFGHVQGDSVLVRMGELLTRATGDDAFPARYGGEEFVVILPGRDAKSAAKWADGLRRQIESAEWPGRPVTASLGVATLGGRRIPPSALINEADRALYTSKARGRNQVTHSGELASAA